MSLADGGVGTGALLCSDPFFGELLWKHFHAGSRFAAHAGFSRLVPLAHGSDSCHLAYPACGAYVGLFLLAFLSLPYSHFFTISLSFLFFINVVSPLCCLRRRQSLLELVFGVKVVITGDGFIPGERSVIIMNHRTRLDWMFLWCCLLRYSYLRLEKICLKAGLKAVPGFGVYTVDGVPSSPNVLMNSLYQTFILKRFGGEFDILIKCKNKSARQASFSH